MDAAGIYQWLLDGRSTFEVHVICSITALAMCEARANGHAVTAGLGLAGPELKTLADQFFPHASPLIHEMGGDSPLAVPEDEACLRDLLARYSSSGSALQQQLSLLIARRAMRPNHLWQDLGLRNRGELSQLLRTHFAPLANRNTRDMKWKKFFYRMICRDEGYRLCTAPSCAECDDFQVCFGDESGESLMARTRLGAASGLVLLQFQAPENQ